MLLKDHIDEHLRRLDNFMQDDTAPEAALALAEYLDREAVMLTLVDEQGGDRVKNLVYGLAYVMGVPWDDANQKPMIDDIDRESARNYVTQAARLVEVVGDHDDCLAYVEASHITVSLIRGRFANNPEA